MTEKIERDLINWGKNNNNLQYPLDTILYVFQLIYDETGEEANDVKKFCDWFNATWNVLSGELTNEIWTKCHDEKNIIWITSYDEKNIMINNYIVLKRIFEIIKNIFSLNKSFKYFIKNYNVDVMVACDTGKFKIYPFYCPATIFER